MNTQISNPLCSVIVPCYKSERVIERIVADIAAQTYVNYEIIIVSNGEGQQKQLLLLNKMTALFKDKMQVVSVDFGNLANARYIGLEKAHGEWVAFVDADDRLDANHLELLMSKADADADMVIGGYYRCDSCGNCVRLVKMVPDCSIEQIEILISCAWNKLYRASFLRKGIDWADRRFVRGQDSVLNARLITSYSPNIRFIEMSGYRYLVNMDNYRIAKYVPNYLEMKKAQVSLVCNFIRNYYFGTYSSSEVEAYTAREICISYFENARNIFRKGSPYRFNSACAELRETIFNNEEIPRFISELPKQSLKYRIYKALYRIGSPTIMAIGVLLSEKVNAIYRGMFR